jgi:hypothetical protein
MKSKTNRILKNSLVVLLIILVILGIPNVSRARYYEFLNMMSVRANIAEPIIQVESLQNKIIQSINKESEIQEYLFVVRNYENENSKKISEVDFSYTIEIISSNENFPIKIELYDVQDNLEILNGKNISENIFIKKEIEYEKQYKLVVTWEKTNNELSDSDNIHIVVNVNQNK